MIGCNDEKDKDVVLNKLDELLRSMTYVEMRHMVKTLSMGYLIHLAKAVHGVMYERFKQ